MTNSSTQTCPTLPFSQLRLAVKGSQKFWKSIPGLFTHERTRRAKLSLSLSLSDLAQRRWKGTKKSGIDFFVLQSALSIVRPGSCGGVQQNCPRKKRRKFLLLSQNLRGAIKSVCSCTIRALYILILILVLRCGQREEAIHFLWREIHLHRVPFSKGGFSQLSLNSQNSFSQSKRRWKAFGESCPGRKTRFWSQRIKNLIKSTYSSNSSLVIPAIHIHVKEEMSRTHLVLYRWRAMLIIVILFMMTWINDEGFLLFFLSCLGANKQTDKHTDNNNSDDEKCFNA